MMWRGRGRERERSFGQSGKVSSRADLSTGGGGGDEANNGLVSHATKNIGSGGGTPGGHGHGRTRPQLTHWTMQWSHRYRFMRRDELDTDRVTETEGREGVEEEQEWPRSNGSQFQVRLFFLEVSINWAFIWEFFGHRLLLTGH